MTQLDDAVKAAMADSGCRRVDSTWGPYCDFHEIPEVVTTWDTARDECSVVGSAVRAGWAAAIDAATAICDEHDGEFSASVCANFFPRLPEGDQS